MRPLELTIPYTGCPKLGYGWIICFGYGLADKIGLHLRAMIPYPGDRTAKLVIRFKVG